MLSVFPYYTDKFAHGRRCSRSGDVPINVEIGGAVLPALSRIGVLIPREESNAMNELTTSTAVPARALEAEALASLLASFERL